MLCILVFCGLKFLFLLRDDYFQGSGGRVGGELDRFGGALQRELVGDEAADIQLAGENQARDFVLQQEIGGVAADYIFFVDANRREIESGFDASAGMGEEEDLAAAAHEGLRFADNIVGGDGDDRRIEGGRGGRAWSVERGA